MHSLSLSLSLSVALSLAVGLALFSPAASLSVRSPSGLHHLPAHLLRRHLPHISPHLPHRALAAHLYEYAPSSSSLLRAPGHSPLSLHGLAPRVVRPPPARRCIVNGAPVACRPPVLRMGKHHVFMHAADGRLLGGWGPGLRLKPVHAARFPGVFVNVHTPLHAAPSLHAAAHPPPPHTNTNRDERRATTLPNADSNRLFIFTNDSGHFKPNWQSEQGKFFDVGMAFDASFCAAYGGGDPATATNYVHAVGVAAHQMTLTRLVSLRIGDVVGFCRSPSAAPPQIPLTFDNDTDSGTLLPLDDVETEDSSTDQFRAPSRAAMLECHARDGCEVPALRLEKFRAAWNGYIGNESQSDAAYLLSDTPSAPPSNIVGAAWVASACSDFGFGWVLGDHSVIVAHEIGHTLGAPHTDTGLMNPFLSLTAPSRYDTRSLAAIQSFLDRLSSQSCLVPRTQGASDERRFSGFTRILRPSDNGGVIEGSDVAAGTVRTHGAAAIAMLQVSSTAAGNTGAELRMTTLTRTADPGFPFTYNNTYTRRWVAGSHLLDFRAGGGVALTPLRDDAADDALVVFAHKRTAKLVYAVGYGVDPNLPRALSSWASGGLRTIPATALAGRAVAVGAAAGRLRSPDAVDLVVAYIDYVDANSTTNTAAKATASYIIGYDLDGRGVPRAGWSDAVDIVQPPFLKLPADAALIGDISVALWPVPGDVFRVNLLFALVARKPGIGWRTSACLANNAHKFSPGGRARPWKFQCYVPRVPPIVPKRLAGGVALVRLLSNVAPVPTSVVFQSRFFSTGASSQWLDVGDGILTRQRPQSPAQPKFLALSVGEDIVPVDTCSRCYAAQHVPQCKERVQQCFFQRQFGKLEKVREKDPSLPSSSSFSARQLVTTGTVTFRPRTSAIFCEGFHSIFVRQTAPRPQGKCAWDAKRTAIIAEGVRSILRNDLAPGADAGVTVHEALVPDDILDILGAGGFGAGFVPTTIDVWVQSPKFIRWKIINAAVDSLRKRPDWNSVFNVDRSSTKISRAQKPNRFRVSLAFSNDLKLAFLTDKEQGKSHDTSVVQR